MTPASRRRRGAPLDIRVNKLARAVKRRWGSARSPTAGAGACFGSCSPRDAPAFITRVVAVPLESVHQNKNARYDSRPKKTCFFLSFSSLFFARAPSQEP